MSFKSIFFSILTIIFLPGFLFVIAFLFGIEAILGIIGIVVYFVLIAKISSAAKNNARGIIDTFLAKYVAPIVGGLITILVIFLLIENGLTGDLF